MNKKGQHPVSMEMLAFWKQGLLGAIAGLKTHAIGGSIPPSSTKLNLSRQ